MENQRLKEELSRMEYSARLGFRLNPERSTSAVDSLMSTTDTEVACIFSGQGRPKKKLFRHCVIGPGDSDEVISADHAAVVSSPIEPLSEKKKFHKPKFMHESVLTADNGDSIPAVGNEFNENIISNVSRYTTCGY